MSRRYQLSEAAKLPAAAERDASRNNRSRSPAAQNVDDISLLNEVERLLHVARTGSYYVRVLELDPRHVQARKRLSEMDIKSPRSISRGSLVNRLTGRRLIRP